MPRDLRPLLKRATEEDEDEDEDEDCDCERNPDGSLVDEDCHCDDEDDDRSDKLTWTERTLLQIEVARRR